jgi:PAS domain S-box-containing protein
MIPVWQQAILRWAVVFLVFSGTSYAQPQPDPLTAEERAWLAAHPTLSLSPDPAYQPVEFFDEQGVFRGISADYLALIEQRLGFRFQVINRDKEQEAFRTGRLYMDAMPTCAVTPERERSWVFTTPYLEFPTYIITRKSVSEPLTLAQLSGSRVAVVGIYAVREYLETNYPQIVVDPVPDARTGLQKVSFGLVDAFVSELPVATYWMEREGIMNLKMAGEAGYVYQLGFGMTKQVAPLQGILEKGLAQIRPEERAAIYHKWVKLSAEPSPFSRRLGLALLGGLGVAGLGLLFVLGWNRTLTTKVKARTTALQQELTERERTEQALQQSEAMFRSLTETTSAWVYIIQNNRLCYVNSAAVAGIEYAREELVGHELGALIHPDDWSAIQARRQARKLGQAIPLIYEARAVTKTGRVLWFQVASNRIAYHNAPAELCTAIDITDRKRAEEQLKISEQRLHQLAGYLQTIREEERTRIAREIHDELGQAMTAMKMDLSWLTKRVPEEQAPIHERLKGMIELVSDTITTVRRLATQLRPGILDDLGLPAALEWQAHEFQTRTGIGCDFVAEADVSDLAPERATAIFRICQEALTNVARHAEATQVHIRLWEEQNQLRLEVQDNGRGISTSETAHLRSFGLLGMQERAFLLGGEFQLTGSPTHGTTVTARIPRYQSIAKGGAS